MNDQNETDFGESSLSKDKVIMEADIDLDKVLSPVTPVEEMFMFFCEACEQILIAEHNIKEDEVDRVVLVHIAADATESRMKLHKLKGRPPKDGNKEMRLLVERVTTKYLASVKNKHNGLVIISK